MKKSLLSLLITLAIVPIANCGIGGIPGNLTLNSVGPGKSSQSLRESTKTTRKHEGPVPARRKTRISAGRGH